MKNLIFLVILFSGVFSVNAQQDKHFSMFYESKVQSNPANAGFFEGDYQAFTNYRNQWSSISDNPYKTISASFDTRFNISNGFLGAGINFYNDVSGDLKYTVNQITVPINYAIELGKMSYLSVGIAPSFYQRSVKDLTVSWDNQWTGVNFNTLSPSGEIIPNDNLSVGKFDLGVGAYWQNSFSKYSWLGIGIAGQHLTKPKINFFDNDNSLTRKMIFSIYGNFGQKQSNLTIKPNLLVVVQGVAKMMVIGSGFDFELKGKSLHTGYYQRTSVELGLYGRLGDAIILNTIFHMSGLSVGLSFDVNVSKLNTATGGFGAMELFLAFKFNKVKGYGRPSVH